MDSNQRRKSGINVPAGMSETSLCLEALSSSPPKSSITSNNVASHHLQPLPVAFLQIGRRAATGSSRAGRRRGSTSSAFEKASPEKEGGNDAYSRLLKSELFGSDFWSFSCAAGQQGSPVSVSPSKNMLRFKTDQSEPN